MGSELAMLRSRRILAAVGIEDADAALRCVLYNFPEDSTQKNSERAERGNVSQNAVRAGHPLLMPPFWHG